MGTRTIRPDGTSAAGQWTATGAASNHAATNDNSDSSYISTTVVYGVSTLLDFASVSPAIPAGSKILSVTLRVRGACSNSQGAYVAASTVLSSTYLSTTYIGWADTTISTVTCTTVIAKPDGSPLTIADLDNLRVNIADNGSVGVPRVYELYLDIVYNEAPVATVTAPTEGGSVTTTTRPTVTWTYTDTEGNAQERYRLKIFSAAQYGAGGFDPETSTPTWDSGEVLSNVTSVDIPIDLVNGTTYRAYVKVADVGSSGRYSAWDNNTFTISVTAPPAPSLTVTAQVSNSTGPRTKLDIVRTSSATATTYMIIEYSDDGGTTWNQFAYDSGNAHPAEVGDQIVNSPDGTTFTFYDYTAIPGVARNYRAKAVRVV